MATFDSNNDSIHSFDFRIRRYWLLAIALPLLFTIVTFSSCGKERATWQTNKSTTTASRILETIDVNRGIVVVLGDSLCRLSRELAKQSELLIYTQFTNKKDVEAARKAVDSDGFYGTRIYVEKGDLKHIHLADNIADVLIAVGQAAHISKSEALRVIRPEGKALVGKQIWSKSFPKGIDDWSHPYHGPDNNTQSNDKVIKAPYLSQFFAEPRYAPATQVAVASGGRVFKAFGDIAFHEREENFLNTLVAFNGYNGTMLWKRPLVPGIMIHRNTLIATPSTLYLGDNKSCKLIDTQTGRIKDEIKPPVDIAGGTFWKWMGMENGTLFALIGEQEQRQQVMRWQRTVHGWPWSDISKGYNEKENPWGFGRNLLAIDPKKKKVLWHHHEDEPADSRALAMKNGRIYLFRFGEYLTCLDAKSGKEIWRKTKDNAPGLFKEMGEISDKQGYVYNWRTTDYMMCSDDALYFAGPQINKLIAVSAKDGHILWQNPYNNFQLILRKDGLYAISGPWGNNVSKKFDPLSGKILAELAAGRRACTRPNASLDAVFYRARGGTVRFDVEKNQQQWISPMRAQCQDGVTVANGFLYWWPYVCDCQLSIYGVTAAGPAGNFDFNQKAKTSKRLEKGPAYKIKNAQLLQTPGDWPTFRQDNQGFVRTAALISNKGDRLWRYPANRMLNPGTDILGSEYFNFPTAPVTEDGLIFWSGANGIVHAMDEQTEKLLWIAYTGGPVRMAPTIWQDCVLVGSGDGWVYNFDARSGSLNWRFRAAPVERKIPVYGSLMSTWPAASGVLVDNGIAYVAAGIVNYDGTHVYALDARTGKIKWQNNSSGHLLREARTGVSVQGQMLLHNGKLYLAGGTSVSPAIYDAASGKCLNDPEPLKKCESTSPRGWELYLVGNQVMASGKPFYGDPRYNVFDASVNNQFLHVPNGSKDIVWVNKTKVLCYPHIEKSSLNTNAISQQYPGYGLPVWGRLNISENPLWEFNCEESKALAVCKNAVVIAEKSRLEVVNIENGRTLWSAPLDYPPVPWGLAVSRAGRIIVTLEDGSIQCFGGNPTCAVPYVSSNNTYFVGSASVTLASNPPEAEIRYTLDGTEPTADSKLFTKPFTVNSNVTLKMRAFPQNDFPGLVVTEKFHQAHYPKALQDHNTELGIMYKYYEGYCDSVSDIDKYQPVKSGIMTGFHLKPREGVNEFAYIFSGTILVPEDGIYTFYSKSNDGSRLYIDGKEVVNNDGGHGAEEKSGKIALKAGEYPIMLKYFQMGGGKMLKVSWEGPGIEKQVIDARVLFHKVSEE